MAIVKRKKINELKFNLTHGAVPQVHIEDIMQQFSVSIANTLNIKTVLNKAQNLCQTLIYLAILHLIVVSNLERILQIEFNLKICIPPFIDKTVFWLQCHCVLQCICAFVLNTVRCSGFILIVCKLHRVGFLSFIVH